MRHRLLFRYIFLVGLGFFLPGMLTAQPLTGSKTVNPSGGDYASLAAAITDVNAKGVSGTFTLLIDADLTESGSPELTTTTLTGANRLVIRPNAGKNPTITFTAVATAGNASNACLTVSGTTTNVGNLTIDGSNTVGGTTRNMTIALNDATNGRYGIRLNGETDNVTIQNLKILATNIKPTTASASRTYGIYSVASSTAAADSLRVINCEIGSPTSAFYYAIYKPDGGTFPTGAGLVISGNTVYGQHKAISVWGTSGVAAISNNTVSVIGHPTGTYVQNSLNGIYVETWMGTVNIFNNKIITLKAKAVTQTTLKHLYGIIAYNAGSPAGQTANIYNNFISDFSYSGDATTTGSEIIGIAVDATDLTVNVYFNTIYMNQAAVNPTAGIRVYDDAGMSANLKNNIVVNAVDHDSAYAIHYSPITNNTLKSSDYNDLYVAGAKASVALHSSVKQKTLANWQTASSQDAHSISRNPANPFGASGQLKSVTDLHWVSAASNAYAGTPLPGYTTDIDGDTRNATKPYMGADEAGPLTGVKSEVANTPLTFALEQNYPNPFNPSTVISCQLPVASEVHLVVCDVLGREVATLVNEQKEPGTYAVTFDATGLASGVYLYRLTAGTYTAARKMVVMK